MRFSPKDVKMTWLGIGKTASLKFRTEKKIFEKNIGGAPEAPLGQYRVKLWLNQSYPRMPPGLELISIALRSFVPNFKFLSLFAVYFLADPNYIGP